MDNLELILHRAIIAAKLNDAVKESDLSYETICKRASGIIHGVKFDSSKLSRLVNGKQDVTYLEVHALSQVIRLDRDRLIPDKVSREWLRSAVERITDSH